MKYFTRLLIGAIILTIIEALIYKATAAEPRTQTLEGPGAFDRQPIF